jgi:biopolymer transport protein ExbD
MGAVAAPEGRSTGKKKLNTELNLVPFIDLLTCLICFLLMTAVWVQLGKISITPAAGHSPNQVVEHTCGVRLVLALTPQGFLLSGNGQTLQGGDILKKDNNFDFDRLGKKLQQIQSEFPEKNDIVLMSEDGIRYQDLINTMDVCLANEFANISLSGTI